MSVHACVHMCRLMNECACLCAYMCRGMNECACLCICVRGGGGCVEAE